MPYLQAISIKFSTTALSQSKSFVTLMVGMGERKHAALGVALHHHVAEGLVEQIHFLLEIAVRVRL